MVIIDNEKLLLDAFVNVATISTPMKTNIKNTIENGKEISGTHFETGQLSLLVC